MSICRGRYLAVAELLDVDGFLLGIHDVQGRRQVQLEVVKSFNREERLPIEGFRILGEYFHAICFQFVICSIVGD